MKLDNIKQKSTYIVDNIFLYFNCDMMDMMEVQKVQKNPFRLNLHLYLKWSHFIAEVRDPCPHHVHPPPDGGRGVADGGGAHEGGQQVRVHRDHVRPGPRVQAQHAAVHRAVHCNQQASRCVF